jgi:hypothetical protein
LGFSALELLGFYLYLEKFIFMNEKIITKYPFFAEKIFYTKDIIGWKFEKWQYGCGLRIFFDKKYLDVELSSKNSKTIITKFINDNYDSIKERNISKIITKGFCVKKSSIVFLEKNIELINYKKQNKLYLYTEIDSIIYESSDFLVTIKIEMKDGNLIKFSNYDCKGGIGLFEYLDKNNNNPHVA